MNFRRSREFSFWKLVIGVDGGVSEVRNNLGRFFIFREFRFWKFVFFI